MRGIIASLLLALACGLALAGCRGEGVAGDAAQKGVDVESVAAELDAFTGELVRKVESSPELAAGAAEAQKFLDARKGDMRARVVSLKQSRDFQESAAARRRWLEAEVENTSRVSRLQTQYLDTSMGDPSFRAQLDRLVADYQALFKD